MYSLNQRLILSLTASLALFFVLQTVMIDQEVERLSEQNIISRLEHDQKTLLTALNWKNDSKNMLNLSRVPDIYKQLFSGHYYEITIKNKTFYSRSLWDEKLIRTESPLVRDVMGPQGQLLLMLSQDFTLHDEPVTIRIAEDVSHLDSMADAFQGRLLLLAAAAVLMLLILQGWIIQYGLKPLQRIRHQLGDLEEGKIDQITTPAPSEIMPLVTEINHLITLMKKRLERSRHALGDLAHALKTPLSVVQQIIERQAITNDMSQCQDQLRNIEKRIEHELIRARTAGPSPGDHWVKPHEDLNELIDIFKKVFPNKAISLNMPELLQVEANREDMLEIFGNILENACKWSDSEVHCDIAMEDKKLLILIDDDGPGIDNDSCEDLLCRGVRADESKPGHGLGLSIVNEIVHAYEGKVTLEKSPTLLGLRVVISLP